MRTKTENFNFKKAQGAIRKFEQGLIDKKNLIILLKDCENFKKSYQQVIHLTKLI